MWQLCRLPLACARATIHKTSLWSPPLVSKYWQLQLGQKEVFGIWEAAVSATTARHRSSQSKAAARAVRKQKHKNRFKYVRVPSRLLGKADGDFPVQLRPYAKAPQIRDLQDSIFDEAAMETERIPKVKPHHVREALRKQASGGSQESVYGSSGLDRDTVETSRLQDQRLQASQIPRFDIEKDLPEEDAAELATWKARALARRNYKWVPNPFGKRPGNLRPGAEAEYYEQYFDGSRGPSPKGAADAENYRDNRRPKPQRQRISPSRFWYSDDHVTPDAQMVALMRSQDLKYCMMNEAHIVRKWRGSQPEGRAAGMPADSKELWLAFGYRAAELATGNNPQQTDALGSSSANDVGGADKTHGQLCSLSTTLRFLQCFASVQFGPYSAIQNLVGRALEERDKLRPLECFYLLQALSRLHFKHPKSSQILERMSLSWRSIRDKHFIKAANAAAKLDLGSNMWAKPLKAALALSLSRFSGRHLSMLKAVTVMELLDAPEAMKTYLELCEQHRTQFWYSRHLRVVELHVHLLHPDVWQQLDDSVRSFLQEVRTAAENSGGFGSVGRGDGDQSSDDESDEETEKGFDSRLFSSQLHADVSRVLSECLGIEHQNRLAAGPLMVDSCHVPSMTVIESAAKWQFYLRSPQITALARRRHELLRAMGFRLVHVPYHRWNTLKDDDQKTAYLRGLLPREALDSVRLTKTDVAHSHEPGSSSHGRYA